MHPLLDPLARHAAERGREPAVGDQSLRLTWAELAAVVAGLATEVDRRARSAQVGVLVPASAAGTAAVLACYHAGRTPVPLNFLLGPETLAEIVRDAEIDLLVTIAHFGELAAALGTATIELNADTLVPGRFAPPDIAADDAGALIYTSGTSGHPKGVQLSIENLSANAAGCIEHFRLERSHVFLSVLPFFHAFGLMLGVLTPVRLGARVCHLPRFSPVAVAQTIADQRVTIFPAVASMFGALCRLKDVPPDVLESLMYPISGGEPLPRQVAEQYESRFGRPLLEGYGLTETSPVVSCNAPWAHRPGSVGRPLTGVEVWAAGADGTRLAPGREGELMIRGHCVMCGYRNRPDETGAALVDGALRTGDVGLVDDDGFVSITGRAKEMLIVSGENVFPREIEEALCAHPAVVEAAVIGQPCPTRGEVPIAFVVVQGEAPDEQELRAHCRGRLPGGKVPRQIHVRADLPRGSTGKVLKRALRAE